MSKSSSEKVAFSERLKQALTRSRKRIDTASELALQFNLRHPNNPVTQQAAQKWLSGLACPTPDKIDTLANWLNVSAHWLRFGPPNDISGKRSSNKRQAESQPNTAANSNDENRLIERFRQLTPHQQTLITEMIIQLTLEKQIWPEPT